MEVKKKKFSLGAFLFCLIGIAVFVWAGLFVANFIANKTLVSYIKSFDAVQYGADRIIPQKDGKYYSLTADEDLDVMVITDIHLGGGFWSHDKDKKTIYEVITMLQNEKPDFVILDGDNIFAVPGPVYNGGGTLNNKMVSRTILELFEHEGVYFSTVFGNHDTEVFDYANRTEIANLYASNNYKYCIFEQNYIDAENDMTSQTNQIITVKNKSGKINKLLLLLDSNAYVDNSIKAVIDWNYDTIHDAQVNWAKKAITEISKEAGLASGEVLKTLAFFHIPTGEYQAAYLDLEKNGFKDTATTKYISGVWDEEINEELGIRVWFGGCSSYNNNPLEADIFFETLGPDGINSLEGVFVGHDHVNNAVVEYKGVMLSYGNSIDNLAYTDVDKSGLQRGCTVITISQDGSWKQVHKNAYTDLNVSKDEFVDVYLDHPYYENAVPSK